VSALPKHLPRHCSYRLQVSLPTYLPLTGAFMKLFRWSTTASLILLGAAAPAYATNHGKASPPAELRQSLPSESMTDAEVRKVDKDSNKITLKHGEIRNLGMPGMTMVFEVKDAMMLDNVKAGDKVRFSAENVDGSIVVTSIEQRPK
jgi:Cu(I)/Ag(I) efflux system periplasmic protein CusF